MDKSKRKVALITGAAGGIGSAVALRLAKDGLRIAALDRNSLQLNELMKIIKSTNSEFLGLDVDISKRDEITKSLLTIEDVFGPIDFLVNAAGMLHVDNILSMREQDWDEIFKINVNGVFNVSQLVARQMVRFGIKGSIVTISSNAAVVPRMNMGAYSASKAAVTQFARCLGLELAEFGIRCNIVSPGSTHTEMLRRMLGERGELHSLLTGCQSEFRLGIPLQRIADANDIAEAVHYLLSEKAQQITMHDLRIDGGASLGV